MLFMFTNNPSIIKIKVFKFANVLIGCICKEGYRRKERTKKNTAPCVPKDQCEKILFRESKIRSGDGSEKSKQELQRQQDLINQALQKQYNTGDAFKF